MDWSGGGNEAAGGARAGQGLDEAAAGDAPTGEVGASGRGGVGRPVAPGGELVPCRWRPTRGSLRTALALVWILDAALQYQPFMFGRGFVTQVLLPMAQGQPAPVAWSITTVAHLVAPDAGVWNFLFATVQLAIGVGLLLPRQRRRALAVMLVWVVAVWWLGEGFGMALAGASPLSGAPGAVLLYGFLGLALWPTPAEVAAWEGPHRSERPTTSRWEDLATQLADRSRPAEAGWSRGAPGADVPSGIWSSAAAEGPWRTAGLIGWTAWWLSTAVLWLVPAQRAAGSVSGAIAGTAGGQPGWYAAFLTRVAHAFSSIGPQTAWVLAVVSLAVAVGPWVSRRPTRFLVAGAVLALALWVTGEGLGGILTGSGTDPNAGPLLVLLAAALLPAIVPARLDAPSPARTVLAGRPVLLAAATVGLGVVLLLAATYPTGSTAGGSAALAGTASSASGTSGGGSGGGSASDTSGGGSTSGMAGMPGMGATGGASSSGGTSATAGGSDGWSYDGPALPAQEVQNLTTVFDDTEEGHKMQTPTCTAAPTAAQMQAAVTLVQQTSAAVARYQELSAATAAGYVPITDPAYPVVHYVNPAYLTAKDVLSPTHVQSLVYAFTPYGPVLVAAMYLMPQVGEPGPMPGGCLTQWHTHTNLCKNAAGTIAGFQPCASGLEPTEVPEMMHVWQVPVPGGALTMDPTDLQVVESAITAQLDGQAPISSPGGTAAPRAPAGSAGVAGFSQPTS